MAIISARNPKYTANGNIDLLVTRDTGLESWYTAAPYDSEAQCRELYERALWGEFGAIAAYSAPEVSAQIPVSVTPRQAKLALLQSGLLDAVEAEIAAIEDATTRRTAQIEWGYAQDVRRDWPLLNQVAQGMGMTDAQIDDLFILAAGL